MRALYRNGPPAACVEIKTAALSSPLGEDLAARWFGLSRDQAIEKFGTYKSGPRKGATRGYIVWLKINQGGWMHGVGVLRPGMKLGAIMDNRERDLWLNKPMAELVKHLRTISPGAQR